MQVYCSDRSAVVRGRDVFGILEFMPATWGLLTLFPMPASIPVGSPVSFPVPAPGIYQSVVLFFKPSADYSLYIETKTAGGDLYIQGSGDVDEVAVFVVADPGESPFGTLSLGGFPVDFSCSSGFVFLESNAITKYSPVV